MSDNGQPDHVTEMDQIVRPGQAQQRRMEPIHARRTSVSVRTSFEGDDDREEAWKWNWTYRAARTPQSSAAFRVSDT